jgi:glycosyltransferase involved in cell wall biosynthesis
MDLSIIVPAYNAEKTLDRCVESLLTSDAVRSGLAEVIVVDDGSSDATWAICSSFADDGRMVAIRTQNSGVSAARNRGMAAASGRFITFVDSDDFVDRDYHVRSLGPLLEDPTLDFSITGFTTVEAGRERRTSVTPGRIVRAEPGGQWTSLLRHGLINPNWNKIYRADVVARHSVEFETGRKIAQDLWFNLDFLRVAGDGCLVDVDGVYFVRDHVSSTRAVANRYDEIHSFDRSLIYREQLSEKLLALGLSPLDVDRYFEERANTWLHTMVKNVQNTGTPLRWRGQVREVRRVLDFQPVRADILASRTSGRLGFLNRSLCRVNSATLTWLVYRFV